MEQENQKGQFQSNFGFLMAALGSAVGLGNLWSFPYKLGIGGGFAFLLIYVILCVFVGYPLVLSEIALGRKSQKAAVEAYEAADRRFKFNGVLQTIVPWLLICFYCTFGGFITKYLWGSIIALFNKKASLRTGDAGELFGGTISNTKSAMFWVVLFLIITMIIVFGGVSGGIEKFCKLAMPTLFFMLVIVVIRSCTLPGAGEGLKFLFAPNLDMWHSAKGFFDVVKLAGGQMFFSLSLCSGSIIAYGSYLDKSHNIEKDAVIVTIGDSAVAILAGMAIMPAVFAYGLEPGAGPGLLFISLTTVFQKMGATGLIFQLLFWLLVFFAALTSSVGMMEAGISSIMDSRIKAGKPASRIKVTIGMGIFALVGNSITTLDQLGGAGWWVPLGQPDWLSVWDALAEGILMPLTGLIMAIMLGWFSPGYINDEALTGGNFKSKKMYDFCIKYLGPLFMIMIVYGQIMAFFGNAMGIA